EGGRGKATQDGVVEGGEVGEEKEVGLRVGAAGERPRPLAAPQEQNMGIGKARKRRLRHLADRDRIMARSADLRHHSPHEPHGPRDTSSSASAYAAGLTPVLRSSLPVTS